MREPNFHELVSAIPAAVYACDENGLITYCNREAIELWGCEPELEGQPWSFLDSRRLIGPEGVRILRENGPEREVIASGLPISNQELVLERPDLSRIWALASVAPLRDSGGTVCGAVSIFQNITEIKRREQERDELLNELDRSNRELSRFSYIVSHDLQAPVRTVRALTELLVRREGSPPEEASRLAEMIDQAAESMQRLIGSLLQYAQAGHGELNRQAVSVEDVIESVRLSLGVSIAKTEARIICQSLPKIDADPLQLGQLFQNLIANAIDYRQPGRSPVIRIQGETLEQGWQFEVTDNGQGIPPEHHQVIFEPLKRLHGSETPGTGLGLAVARQIVVRHGGTICVESDGVGCGSSFRFNILKAVTETQAGRSPTTQPIAAKARFAVPKG